MTTAAIDPSMTRALSARPTVDAESAPYFGLSAMLHTLFLLLAMVVPPGAASMELDGVEQRDNFVSIANIHEQPVPEPARDLPDESPGAEAAAKHAGEEGAAGAPDAAEDDRRMAIEKKPDDVGPKVAHERDLAIAASAGVEGVFRDHEITSMWSKDAESVGKEAFDALGNLDGAQPGRSHGFGGWSTRDTGRGGGGHDDESFGLAKVKTRGRGGDDDKGDDYGRHEADLGEHQDDIPEPVPGPPVIDGPLDRKIIQRVVRQHRRELGFCYQKELQQNPTLSGRVVMKFTIAGDGSVISALAASNTMGSRAVAACLGTKIRHWHFPAPSTTGLVTVNYPFRFSRASEP